EWKIFGKIVQLGTIASLGLSDPSTDLIEMIDFVEPFERGHALGSLDAMQTGVVVTAFHHCRAKLLRQNIEEKRNVFLEQLLLQVLGAGRVDDPPSRGRCRRDRRHLLREPLARAGSG